MNITYLNSWHHVGHKRRAVVVAIALLILAVVWGWGTRSHAESDSVEWGIDAASARYELLGQHYIARGADADAARWTALASLHTSGSAALPGFDGVQPGIDASAARYEALGRWYAARGADANAARWTALAAQYMSDSTTDGSAKQPYTDVSLFYAERMRAQARANAALAANPELMFARRAYGSPNELATSPELLFARSAYGSPNELAASPELLFARRGYGSPNELAASPELSFARRAYLSEDAMAVAGTSSGPSAACSPDQAGTVYTLEQLFFLSESGC
jgi:hypothetical protein